MPVKPLVPYWSDDRTTLYHGEVRDVLRRMPERSVQCVATSPPYWGLRDYGVDGQLGAEPSPDCGTQGKVQCGRCFVCSMVGVFRGLWRVLRDDGTCWLNLGDSYTSGGRSSMGPQNGKQQSHEGSIGQPRPNALLPPGNLVGVPWRVALALQADGWILRQEIIWAKPAPMPESVKTRCTKAHEQVFLLAKTRGYFYDKDAIAELAKHGEAFHGDYHAPHQDGTTQQISKRNGRKDGTTNQIVTANKRSVWTVPSSGYEGAHFATFPPALVEPMILAGTSAHGACSGCGAPWRRVVESEKLVRDRPNEYVKRTGASGTGNSCGNTVAGVRSTTTGWEPTCGCVEAGVVPCTVLDPFVGSGTTCSVAAYHGRRSVGIDLNEEYLRDHASVRAARGRYEGSAKVRGVKPRL